MDVFVAWAVPKGVWDAPMWTSSVDILFDDLIRQAPRYALLSCNRRPDFGFPALLTDNLYDGCGELVKVAERSAPIRSNERCQIWD